MSKNNTEHRKSLIQRVDHHEKIIGLLADRLNNNVDPELKMLAGAIQKNKTELERLNTWLDRSWWQRMKDRLPW